MYNNVTLIGYLGSDAETRTTRSDSALTVLSLATGRAAHVFIPHRDLRKLRQLGYFRPARVEAALGPAGLVYSYNVAAPPSGRVVFVPLAALRFR